MTLKPHQISRLKVIAIAFAFLFSGMFSAVHTSMSAGMNANHHAPLEMAIKAQAAMPGHEHRQGQQHEVEVAAAQAHCLENSADDPGDQCQGKCCPSTCVTAAVPLEFETLPVYSRGTVWHLANYRLTLNQQPGDFRPPRA